jgi:DHA1 family bicyclomycin/chloramphenicol resistance-like MFS transporter
VFFAFLAGAPYIVVEVMQRPASEYGFYFVLVSGGYMLGNGLAARFSSRMGPGRMLVISNTLALLAVTFFWVFHVSQTLSPIALFGPMGLIAIANGMGLPNSMVGAVSVEPRMAGTASGLSGFLQMGIGGLVTVLVGRLQEGSELPTITVMTVCALLALIFLQPALSSRNTQT